MNAVRAAERSSPCMGSSAGNTGGSRRPETNDTERGASQGCKSLNDSAAGVDPTAGGEAGASLVGVPQGGGVHVFLPSGGRGAIGWMEQEWGRFMSARTLIHDDAYKASLRALGDVAAVHGEVKAVAKGYVTGAAP